MAPKRQAAVEAAELNKAKVAGLPEDDDESEDDGDYAPPAQDEVRAPLPALKRGLTDGHEVGLESRESQGEAKESACDGGAGAVVLITATRDAGGGGGRGV